MQLLVVATMLILSEIATSGRTHTYSFCRSADAPATRLHLYILEQTTRLELATSAWRAEMLPTTLRLRISWEARQKTSHSTSTAKSFKLLLGSALVSRAGLEPARPIRATELQSATLPITFYLLRFAGLSRLSLAFYSESKNKTKREEI